MREMTRRRCDCYAFPPRYADGSESRVLRSTVMRFITHRKRLLLIIVALVLLSQAPLIYARFRLRRLSQAIQVVNSQRNASATSPDYRDYAGVIHVHSLLGGHSTGTFADIIAAASSERLDFIVMTEHPSSMLDTAGMTLRGMHNGVLFLNGNEVVSSSGDRLLVVPGYGGARDAYTRSTREVIAESNSRGALAIVAYPHDFHSWDAAGYDGIEVYNLLSNVKRANLALLFLKGLWCYWGYADLMFATFYARPDETLRIWDEITSHTGQRLVATGGADAHDNIGLGLQDRTGKTLLGIDLVPYERSFRLVRNHVLVERGTAFTEETLLAALRGGHSYISFDIFGDPSGFGFTAENGKEHKLMGDEIQLSEGVHLVATTPVPGHIVILRNGQPVAESRGSTRCEFMARETGVYRVEVYLSQLPEPVGSLPWIISNPIYVR